MRGACAIVSDIDKTFISFASIKGKHIRFVQEAEVPIAAGNPGFIDSLKGNIETLEKTIRENEKKHSSRFQQVFVELPWNIASRKLVNETVLLKREKKISPADISSAKRHLEEKFLNWDDLCIHNIVINYEVEGENYDVPPIGIWSKKIKMYSLLVWIKDKMHKETENLFGNFDRNFGDFIIPEISIFCTPCIKSKRNHAVMNIGHNKTDFVFISKKGSIFSREFAFGQKKILEELSKRFILPSSLSGEVFDRYVSFKELPYDKEITVKKDEGYFNLSNKALNSFIKNYVKDELSGILQESKDSIGSEDDFRISFIGRLNAKKGFYGFLKNFVGYQMEASLDNSAISSSFGCLRYGVLRFMENNHSEDGSLFRRLASIYNEYF